MNTKNQKKEAAMNGGFLRAPGAAGYVGLSTSTLAKMRLRGDGPLYSKAGARIVVYAIGDLDAWLFARRRQSTSEEISTAA
jgi:predicted DNA-binding transcriptional regulator AlpA